MPSDRSNVLLTEAAKALKEGKPAEALAFLDRALAVDPDNAEIYELIGVSHMKLGRAEAAGEAFQRATMLSPSARTFYNLAVHLYELGEMQEAQESASEALKLNPKHAGAQLLLKKIAGPAETPQNTRTGKQTLFGNLSQNPEFGFGKKHLFQVLGEHQKEWMTLGWFVVGMAIFATILVKFNFPLQAPAKPDFKSPFMGYKPIQSVSAFATIGLFITSILGSMIWTSVDLIDRRGRALWMVPMMLCCFMFMPFLPQAFYMVAGRKD